MIGTRDDYNPMTDEEWAEILDERAMHQLDCPKRVGGDCICEFVTGPLSMLRCSECGELLDAWGGCRLHGATDAH